MALAEPNTDHQELQQRETGYFILNDATQENQKLKFKSPNYPSQGLEQVFEGLVKTGI